MDSRRGFYLRMPEEARAELEQAHWDTHLNRDEILLQGLAIWRHAQRKGSLDKLLVAMGYQGKRSPEPAPPAAAAANGSAPPKPAQEPSEDPWDLDRPVLDHG